MVFRIIALVKTVTDEPVWIDNAYGYAIYKCGGNYIASDVEKHVDNPDIHGRIQAQQLEELYERLYTEHIRNIQVYVHTGLPKTATTYLQKHVFPYLKDVHYIAKEGENDFFNDYFVKIRFGNHIIIQDEIQQQFLEYVRFVDERKVLISEEALSEPRNNGRHFMPNTMILAKIFPSVNIIFTIRYQIDFIESFYLQDLRVGGCMSIDAFLRYNKKKKTFLEFESTLVPKISVYYLDYRKFIAFYLAMYGSDNVKVMVYERLKEDKEAFISDLCNFIGTEFTNPTRDAVEHRSYSWPAAYCALWLNRLTYSKDGRLGVIVEKPYVEALDSLIERMSNYLGTANMGRYRRFVLKILRVMLNIVRLLMLKISVQNFSNLIDLFVKHTGVGAKGTMIDKEKKQILRNIYNELNKDLDKKYCLNLKTFNYYD